MTAKNPYWNMEMETILHTPAMEAIQLSKIKKLVKHLYDTKPYWRERMENAGVKPEDIQTLDDFSRRIPILDKAERHRLSKECGGDLAAVTDLTTAVPLEDLDMLAATSGTTGEPTPYPITQNDFEWMAEIWRRIFWRMGIEKGDRVLQAFGLSMFLVGVPAVRWFTDAGACVIPVGAEAGTERILKFAKYFQANTLACTPSLAGFLPEKAETVLGEPVKSLGIKRIICAGEPGAGIPSVRERIQDAYGATPYDFGGPMGISCDHAEYQGIHMVAEDYLRFEIVDPQTHEPIKIENGATGLYVVTTLEGEGFLWFRETFGDIVQVFTDPCPCGRTGIRMKYIGRNDDMLKIKGSMVYPAAINDVIGSFAPRVTGHFRIVLDEPPPRVVPPLKLKVEYAEGMAQSDLAALSGEIQSKMSGALKVRPEIEWLAPGTLPRATKKANLFEKTYEA